MNAKSDFRVNDVLPTFKTHYGPVRHGAHYKLQDLYIKVSMNNFQSFEMSLV